MPLTAEDYDENGGAPADKSGFNPFDMLSGMFGGGGDDDSAPTRGSKGRGRVAVAAKVREARTHVSRLLTVADGLVTGWLDPHEQLPAQISPALRQSERNMIEEPLAELVAESKKLAQIAGVSQTLSLTVGVSMWAMRCYAAWRYTDMEKKVHKMGVGVPIAPDPTEFASSREDDKPHYTFVPEAPEMPIATNGAHEGGIPMGMGVNGASDPAASAGAN